MKSIKCCTLLIVLIVFFIGPYSVNAQEKKSNLSSWPELKSFHMVIAQTFHPAEEGNLKPIRERSDELYNKALILESSKVPADFNKPEILRARKELSELTKDLDDLIKKNESDEEVMKSLTSVHDSFHKIVGLCSKDNEEHHEKSEEKTKE